MRFIAIIVFLACAAVSAQDISLPEEKITGRDLSIHKTGFLPVQTEEFRVRYPALPAPVLREKPRSSAETVTAPGNGRMRDIRLTVRGGSFSTAEAELSVLRREAGVLATMRLGAGYSDGYRAHSGMVWQNLDAAFIREKTPLDFSGSFFNGRMELPGPVGLPFSAVRENRALLLALQAAAPHAPVNYAVSERYYEIDNLQANYLAADVAVRRGDWTWKSAAQWQDIVGRTTQTGILAGLAWERDRLRIGASLKGITGAGARVLPELRAEALKGLTFNVNGVYDIADYWPQVQKNNYMEMTAARLLPEEHYQAELAYEIKKEPVRFRCGVGRTWWKTLYTWKDTDGNFLWEPFAEKDVWSTDVKMSLAAGDERIAAFFVEYSRNFYDRTVEYLPEDLLSAGIRTDRGIFRGKVWVGYTGARQFSGASLDGYATVNAECSVQVRPNCRLGLEITNLAGQDYEWTPGYPGEPRKVLGSIQLQF